MGKVYLAIVLAPLTAFVITGLFGRYVGRAGAHWFTIVGVGVSFALSTYVLKLMLVDGAETYNGNVYTWMVSDGIEMHVGFLIDRLSALMMTVVSFVSLLVHVYTIGYMRDDPGYQRFFSYIALFTFSMLMLVMSNNFLQLYFGWEAVGLASYLLIGFWYKRPTAIHANLKAFIVNRVGDFGFILGIAGIVYFTGSLDYYTVFGQADLVAGESLEILPGRSWNAMTVICILLFIGAMGKSAQMPLHVWLPDSMEGPTPISALIHAATMVTAGIFMVARMSPLYEFSQTALIVVLTIGGLTAFLTGLIGIVQNDIKRIVAYSTLSQLGYMMVALGVSAYAAGIFHLMTHAFFKALLFLAAGSVIIALHHEQDIRKMGGLRKYMPITYVTCLIGSVALAGLPPFAGFFSKDAIIEAVHASVLPGSDFVYWLILSGVFITALYTFRLLFVVFHGEERMDADTKQHAKESPAVVWVPLVLLAIPSIFIGLYTIGPILFGDYFGSSLVVKGEHDVLAVTGATFTDSWHMVVHAFTQVPVYLALAGTATAWYLYLRRPDLPQKISDKLVWVYNLLVNKYYFDEFNENVIAAGTRGLAHAFWHYGDEVAIDGTLVNGSARAVGWISRVFRQLQSGYLYHYAFAMIIGLSLLLAWLILKG